jgi:hypothetical protein
MKKVYAMAFVASVIGSEVLAQDCPRVLSEDEGSRAVVLLLGDERVGGKIRLEGTPSSRDMLFSLESQRTGQFSVLKTVVETGHFLRQTGFFAPAPQVCSSEQQEVDGVVISMNRYVPTADREVVIIAHAASLAGVTVSSFDISVPADGGAISVQETCERIEGEFDLERWKIDSESRLGVAGLELGGKSEAQNAECAVSDDQVACLDGQVSGPICEAPAVFSSNEEMVFSTRAPVDESAGGRSRIDRLRQGFERARRSGSFEKLERALKRTLVELSRPRVLASQTTIGRSALRRGVVIIQQLLTKSGLSAGQRRRYLRELSQRLATVAKG